MTLRRRDERLLSKQADRRATAGERERLEARARDDAEVRRALERDRRVVEALSDLPEEAPPYDLVAAAERRLADTGRRRSRPWGRLAWAAVALAAVVGGVVALRVPRPGRAPAPIATVAAAPIVAEAVAGTVWTEDAAGRHRTQAGDTVAAGARLETEDDGQVTLKSADRAAVTVFEETSVELTGAAGAVRWSMRRGVLRAESFDRSVPVEIAIRGLGDAVSVRQGATGVLADGAGGFAVACTSGRVEVVRAGRPQAVAAGQQLVVGRAGHVLSEPTPELSLEVAPVGPIPAGVREVEVTGRTRPGVLLTVAGRPVEVADDGSFSLRVAFDGRRKKLAVHVRDALARSRDDVVALAPAHRPGDPMFRRIETQWVWEGPRNPG